MTAKFRREDLKQTYHIPGKLISRLLITPLAWLSKYFPPHPDPFPPGEREMIEMDYWQGEEDSGSGLFDARNDTAFVCHATAFQGHRGRDSLTFDGAICFKNGIDAFQFYF